MLSDPQIFSAHHLHGLKQTMQCTGDADLHGLRSRGQSNSPRKKWPQPDKTLLLIVQVCEQCNVVGLTELKFCLIHSHDRAAQSSLQNWCNHYYLSVTWNATKSTRPKSKLWHRHHSNISVIAAGGMQRSGVRRSVRLSLPWLQKTPRTEKPAVWLSPVVSVSRQRMRESDAGKTRCC